MSFGLSIGDIILCSQITYRLFVAATSGRKNAPRGLRDLEDTLFALHCSLNHLKRTSETVSWRSYSDAGNIHEQLELMIRSCCQTLEELEKATAKYREAVEDHGSMPQSYKALKSPSQQFTTQVKIQWRMFMWDFRGESLSQYRRKLESQTDAISLLLSTFIWSATDRIEEDGRRQEQRMEELLNQTARFNSALSHVMQNLYLPTAPRRSSTLPDQTTSNALFAFKPGSSRPVVRL
ncbi:hypothetical protein N7463_007734 [Penicillium fimorum]|uniref:Fungal N-terminal domain-containing protein n=1 Tax=Penicillium fimorum TaxID=1882269 RepID=A0A9X0C7W2_9EURO|nr:hypothetical protein N7463_007734 [Penicillium fimorum]